MSEIRTDTINNASGDNDSGIDLSTNDQVSIKTANTTALTVDASQNVGIGTSSPDGQLHLFASDASITPDADADDFIVESNSATGITIGSSASSVGSIRFADSGSPRAGMIYYSHITDQMRLYTAATQRVTIDSSGRLLVGNSGYNIGQDGAYLQAAGSVFSRNTTSGATQVNFANPNGVVGSISTSNNSTSYNTSSDHRLKENVTTDWDATTRLKQLNPVRFNFIADADTTVDGFLAHEVQSVVPEAISGTHNEVDADGNPVYQGIDQSKLVPLLVKTIQELEARITALENS